MEDVLEQFEYFTDATDKVDQLIEDANKLKNRKERKAKLNEAQALINAIEDRCGRKLYKELV